MFAVREGYRFSRGLVCEPGHVSRPGTGWL